MSRRRQEIPLAKPAIVLSNAYKAVASDRTAKLTSDTKIGDHLAALGDSEATITWKQFVLSVAEKFDNKHFSRSFFWIACLKQNVNPLHVIEGINNLRQEKGKAPPVVDFCVYLDAQQELEDAQEAFRKLDKLVSVALAFKAPYEQADWFPLQNLQNLEAIQHYTLARHVGTTDEAFAKFVGHSANAKAFCLRHIENIIEHSTGKEQAELLTKLMDSMTHITLTHDANHQLKLNGMDIQDKFESCLELISAKVTPSIDHERYGYGYYIGKYINQTYSQATEYERVAQALGKTGVNGMTRSLGQEVFQNPGRFMPLAVAMGEVDATRLFAQVAHYTASIAPNDTLALVDDYDRWYRHLGLGTLLKTEALFALTSNLEITELLHQRGLVDYEAMSRIEDFKTEDFCQRKGGEWKGFLKDRADIERWVKLCVDVGAGAHLQHLVDEDLVKNKTCKSLADESLRKDFFEVLLETKAIDPDEILKTPKRIEKMIALGVSPHALQTSKKYSGKWMDTSFSTDLGL
ncbi:hypothetical protein [Pseudomonas amygdali]|uniref:Uncharacterized protein n=2 Tax=Pseudomonas amygdali pv. lachrymans TaxID=53707 RepID=A0ABR5KRJ5_PSEAV|nr:hypothetical protein [Pseudomonas amygdali]AXH60000.1 hypothetical protein PLA107_032765 [Pseudomonas amygdali pv. lachrymans str. M301315]KPC17404.1 Uncharacterized protein AC499_0606 [Pseudomonas amygdali pv. lachrymans]RMT06006.1 hypothetical protein ALP54_06410 [Pseudomonas amygdali pv. lachrymans]